MSRSMAKLTYGVRSSSMRMAIVRSSAIPSDSGAHRQSSRWLAGWLAGWIGYVYGVPCEVMPSGDDEEIKINSPRSIITKYACGHYYHVGFCPKCFVLNIKAKRKEKKAATASRAKPRAIISRKT